MAQEPLRDWIVIARDEQINGSRIVQIRAGDIKSAYDLCIHTFVMQKWGLPAGMSAVEVKPPREDQPTQGTLLCQVFDAREKAGLFNGKQRLFEPEQKEREHSCSP